MDKATEIQHEVHSVKRGRKPRSLVVPDDMPEPEDNSAAQAYAERIWNGQSPDLSTDERIARCHAGLIDQGMNTDVELPPA